MSSDLCFWLPHIPKLHLQILGKQLAPLWHSRSHRCHLAHLPAQSRCHCSCPGRRLWSCPGLGLSCWQESAESSQGGGSSPFVMKSVRGSRGLLSPSLWGKGWREVV